MNPPSLAYKILVADDDVAIATILHLELTRDSYEVIVCGDGLTAVERIMAWRPHLVILDHQMPGLDGRSICTRIRRSLVGVRVIMLTASSKLNDRVAGLDAGADDYLCKPFEMEELRARIRAQLRDVPVLQDVSSDAAVAPALSIRVLGTFQLIWRDTEMSNVLFNRRQPLQLLKMLLASYDRPMLSEVIEDALWPEIDAQRSRRSLHVVVQRLRSAMRTFGPARVQTCAGGYSFRLQPDDDLDLKRFDSLAASIGSQLSDGNDVPFTSLNLLLDTYGGDLFSEERYSDWAVTARNQVRATFVDLLRRGAVACARAHQPAARRQLLTRLVDFDPSNESFALDLATCLLEQNDAAAAASVLDRVKDVLIRELDVPPGAAWQALWDQTRR